MPDTKTILIQTALKLFAQKGIGNVQAKEIALTAGTVPNAITYHFGGIDGLVDAVWIYAFEQFDHSKLENYYQNNRHLLTSSDDKRQFVTELVGILFDLISGDEKSSTVNLFLMTASVTESGQQKIKEHISSVIVKILMQIYMDISGNNDKESAFAWTLSLAGAAVLHSVNAKLFTPVFPDEKIPANCYGRIQYMTTRNALFSLGLLPE